MKHFLIIANKKKDKNLQISERIRTYLLEKGAVCHIYDEYYRDQEKKISVPKDTQCIFVIGGDGTILSAARQLVGSHIPLMGVNLGTLGFLADVKPDDLEDTLERLLKDDYQIEERLMLSAKIYQGGICTAAYTALNDFDIHRRGDSNNIGLKVKINDVVIDRYHGDGIIVCTPTGATGYNLSAGGPIINPTCRNFVITPICAHALTARSIVLAENDVVKVTMEEVRGDGYEEAVFTCDGVKGVRMKPGDYVVIYRAHVLTPFIRMREVSFVQILKEKLIYPVS